MPFGRVSLVCGIDEEFRTFLDSQLDVAGDLVAVYTGDQRTHLGAGLGAVGDLEFCDAFSHAREQGLGGSVSHGNGDRDRHAALARGTEGRAGERVGRLVHVGIRHDDHVVLRPAQRLHPLAGAGAAAVDVLRHRRWSRQS